MEPLKTLIKLWKTDKHIPNDEKIESLLPKKNEQVKSLHGLAMQPDLVSAINLTLSTLHTAWKLLETGICVSDGPDNPEVDREALTTEELLVIAKVVPLFIPEEMALSLQASHPLRKRKHESSDDESENEELTLEEILSMGSADDDAIKIGFFGSSSSARQSKRSRVKSAKSEESEGSADEHDSKSDSKRSARKKSESPNSVVLVGVKAKIKEEDGGKKASKERKERKMLKPKSKSHGRKSEDNAAEDIKEEEED
ncbi:hypothetical protein ISF_07582 [Cordyceps fumosorosea ARSEF 2679]|uniref:Uncharacterized protein n=1 Tax=Cordyceps fumosorosea (strain ARSEF 2679) TaxID=1081104 RepID=A0A167NVB3_CORFA|nr:hypothetical protein ISF_07582 [Cordyceps fumosorosea ARSEF 2679]OAA55984.1 hypothetical protein ISF_07582 [Cordyceps fumosorosea ARSEF 2679]